MDIGRKKLDEQHSKLVDWGTSMLKSIIDFMEASQIEDYLTEHVMKSPVELEQCFSELLDMTSDKSKKFVQDFLLRKSKIEQIKNQQKMLMEQAKKNKQTKKKQKIQAMKRLKRDMCHCQAMIHELVSNCTGCGRIICDQEGEGECLHCGTMVESIFTVPDDEDEKRIDPSLQAALEKRDKLLQFDKIAGHSVIKDQQSDWYELENDTWQTKEQREFAKKIREFEEQRIMDEQDAVFLNIGGDTKDLIGVSKGKITKTMQEVNEEANEYINQLAADKVNDNIDYDQLQDIKDGFKDMTIKSCQFLDEKSKELLHKLKEDTIRKQEEEYKKKRRKEVFADIPKQPMTKAQDSFSERLQSENPFEEFKREIEKALKQQEEDEKRAEEQRKLEAE